MEKKEMIDIRYLLESIDFASFAQNIHEMIFEADQGRSDEIMTGNVCRDTISIIAKVGYAIAGLKKLEESQN